MNRTTTYIDPTTDFGFKRIFGTDANKDLLKAFLNELFRGRKTIADLYYNKNEHVGDTEEIGTVIFDLTCTADNGEQFIIEVQRSSQINLKKRMLYYGSKLISDQAPKGGRKDWNYDISEVYVIVLMDGFKMPDGGKSNDFLHDVCLCKRETGEVFYGDLGFIYLELINFTKEEADLQNDLEGWFYVLKNMSSLDKLPTYLRKPVFEKLFQIAEYGKLSKEEKEMYDVSLKRKWDAEAVRQYQVQQLEEARQEARQEGEEKKSYEVVEKLLTAGKFTISEIANFATVSEDFVNKVRASLSKKK
ncbi:Rpn family recombination-promoting nuclease/putative transposase [Sphingobacterium hotanense]|uniref:Rpn family recombination-promoting nuclease/putative transposase n=1 Tax=Sphingobacterium hotanense TaxID=649196 RepID=UPI0021A6B92C|nr:Rpn family recombination-promoting nuclease/putative transposase [Sphingobacterium hotanense]MCT1526216.1 Rpn family recombination-promoting nuclease/putative transposase [Sphingobacterium hotanense]